MKKLLLLCVLLFTVNTYSQMVVKVGEHLISVEDTLTQSTVEKYILYVESEPINYEKNLKEIKEIRNIERERSFIGELNSGVILLNSRLDNFPNTKEVVILHYLAKNNGMKISEDNNPHVKNSKFDMIARNEDLFGKQLKADTPYKYIVERLIKEAPLKSSL